MTTKLCVVREDPLPISINAVDDPQKVIVFYDKIISQDPAHDPDKEAVHLICHSTRLNPKSWHLISLGTINESACHPREVLRPAIVAAAYAITLIHNHPSGDPTPSRADETVTRRIREASELMQISLLDHVIVTPRIFARRYFSFRESGMI